MTVVSGTSPAMIPSAAKAPRWASVTSTSTCAAADSQPTADTQGGDSPACRSPSTPVTVNKMVGTAEARNVSQSPRQPSATSPVLAFPAAACTPANPNDAPMATMVWVITHPARDTRSKPQPG